MKNLLHEAEELFSYTQGLRRDFHRHPEIGFQEVRTAGIVAQELRALGLEVTTGVAKTGVVALLEGGKPGPVVLMRFDMDALPIEEETGAIYRSVNPGVMHACGHDAHTAIGLTVAKLLHRHQADFAGTAKFVFQPAEEGLGGAQGMVAEGVLENPRPAVSLALHVWNDKPFGWIGVTDGPAMAGAEVFEITLQGKGGHGASPHESRDPVFAAAQIVTALQSIVSRNVSPLEQAVVSVTMVHAGVAFNVIPSSATLQGTIRTFNDSIRSQVLERMQEIVTGVAGALGCTAELALRGITPVVDNDPEISARVRTAAGELFPEMDIENGHRTMGSEDMSLMMQDIPGAYFFVGSANAEEGLDAPHHNPKLDIDERVLPVGAALMTAAALAQSSSN
jgi:amidohydrolase